MILLHRQAALLYQLKIFYLLRKEGAVELGVNKVREAINKTREYGKIFGVEYDVVEIKERIVGNKLFKETEIEAEVKYLGIITKKSKKEQLFYRQKLLKAKELADLIGKRFKEILMIGVTGSVAAGRPDKKSDIDLMIITCPDTLWLTRLKLRAFILFKGISHREYGKVEVGDDFCFNLWLDANSLKLPLKKQNLKNAMDLILMKPVLNKESVYEKFISENDWVKNFVATGYTRLVNSNKKLVIRNKRDKTNTIIKILNWVAYLGQYLYMRKKISSELVGEKYAYFHPKKT